MLPAWCLLAVLALAAVRPGGTSATQPACPPYTARVPVFIENLSADATVQVSVEGALADPAGTCVGGGATTYAASFTCSGSPPLLPCGELTGLRPGAWVNRVALTVTGSAPQAQTRRGVFIAGPAGAASNFLVWTAYAQTFSVTDATPASLRAALDAAAASTAANPTRPALVTFSAAAFPGSDTPTTIDLGGIKCTPDAARAALCFTGSRVVVDALDDRGEPGGVVLSVGTRPLALLRVYGSDNVLRGLALTGTSAPTGIQFDTIAITGATARRNRIEQCTIVGPSNGDAVSVDHDAGQADEVGPGDNVIAESRVTGAEDKGLKVDFGGAARIERTCLHDNRNGGVQSTLGGHVVAVENVVQHNVPGAAQNGLSVRGTDARRSTLATQGNVVRFSGGRGLSVTDNAEATFQDDYVADNQFKGSAVETTTDGLIDVVPVARFHGVALVCNRHANLTGTCDPTPAGMEPAPCGTVEDCCTGPDGSLDASCVAKSRCANGSFPRGAGAFTARFQDHAAPDASYGDGGQPGYNAFTTNKNIPPGANFQVVNITAAVPAVGNQWEHCPTGAPCDTTPDLSPSNAPVDAGVILDPHAADGFGLDRVTPARPRAGEIVRVYGHIFNAIDGNPAAVGDCADPPVCAPDGSCPTGPCVNGTCPCSIENPGVQLRNKQTNASRIRIKSRDGTIVSPDLYPDAVTPTMLAFRMPFDCFAPLVLEVAKYDPSNNRVIARIPLCDPEGCAGQPAGLPCDDGNVCTVGDACSEAGLCVGAPLVCAGACLTGACDPQGGCVAKPATVGCDDGNPCTVGDHCRGTGDVCVPGGPRVCTGVCLTGRCDPAHGCEAKPVATPCDDGNACTVAGTCTADGVCAPGRPLDCTGACLTGACDPGRGCEPSAATSPCDDGDACTVGDHCSGAGDDCVPGAPRSCDDDNVCTDDSCDASAGCRHVSNTAPCDDGDPCTIDRCAGGQCTGEPLPAFAWESCELRKLDPVALCAPERVPLAFARSAALNLGKAERLLERASSTERPARRRRLVHAAKGAVAAIQKLSARAARSGRITAACAATIEQGARKGRGLLSGLAT